MSGDTDTSAPTPTHILAPRVTATVQPGAATWERLEVARQLVAGTGHVVVKEPRDV